MLASIHEENLHPIDETWLYYRTVVIKDFFIMHSNTLLPDVKNLLARSLQLGARADALTPASALLGALPELDSMAVVAILTALEEHFGFSIDDDEISADTFATLGSLADFVENKLKS